jgi:hypothetical protein
MADPRSRTRAKPAAPSPASAPAPADQPAAFPAESDKDLAAALTPAQAAKAVGLSSDDVFAFREYPDRITVVTRAGRKLHAAR